MTGGATVMQMGLNADNYDNYIDLFVATLNKDFEILDGDTNYRGAWERFLKVAVKLKSKVPLCARFISLYKCKKCGFYEVKDYTRRCEKCGAITESVLSWPDYKTEKDARCEGCYQEEFDCPFSTERTLDK